MYQVYILVFFNHITLTLVMYPDNCMQNGELPFNRMGWRIFGFGSYALLGHVRQLEMDTNPIHHNNN